MRAASPRSRPGFTLVALLVLLALGGLFLALFFPAVLKVRAAAGRTQCVNNLKQLAIAAHNYHSAFERLPPGWMGPNPDAPAKGFETPASYAGCLVVLMPYYEQDNLYKQIWENWDIRARTDKNTEPPGRPDPTVPWWKAANPMTGVKNWDVAKNRIKMLVCAEDDPYAASEATIVALSVYGPTAPKDFLEAKKLEYKDTMEARMLGRTNYVGVAGMAGRGGKTPVPGAPNPAFTFGLYEGIFYNRSDSTLGQIAVQDGTSNTLMFGEALGGLESPKEGEMPQRLTSFSYFCGALPTYHGLPPAGQGPWHSFSSRHTRAVNFARGDGSVISIRRGQTATPQSNDWWVLQEMAGKRDGGLRPTSTLVD